MFIHALTVGGTSLDCTLVTLAERSCEGTGAHATPNLSHVLVLGVNHSRDGGFLGFFDQLANTVTTTDTILVAETLTLQTGGAIITWVTDTFAVRLAPSVTRTVQRAILTARVDLDRAVLPGPTLFTLTCTILQTFSVRGTGRVAYLTTRVQLSTVAADIGRTTLAAGHVSIKVTSTVPVAIVRTDGFKTVGAVPALVTDAGTRGADTMGITER